MKKNTRIAVVPCPTACSSSTRSASEIHIVSDNAPTTIIERIRSMRSALSVTEFADLMGMGRNTVYTLVRSGRIPSMKVGSVLRLDPVIIADWLECRSDAA
jgi:excisionase family DNA binding protein